MGVNSAPDPCRRMGSGSLAIVLGGMGGVRLEEERCWRIEGVGEDVADCCPPRFWWLIREGDGEGEVDGVGKYTGWVSSVGVAMVGMS